LHAIVKLSGARAGAVRLITEDERSMRLVGSVGLSPEVVERERLVPIDCGVCGAALRCTTGIASADAGDCRMRTGIEFFDGECRNVLALPLECKGWTFGVYNLFMPDRRALPGDVPALLRVMGEMFGGVLHDARMHNEALVKSVVSERRIIAGELHDSVVQSLMYMRIRLALLEDEMHAPAGPAPGCLADIRDALDSAYAGVRELLTNFRASMDPRGLMPTLTAMADAHEARTGIRLSIDNAAGALALGAEQELQVFLILQEALANIVRHAHAKSAFIRFERDSHILKISIDDDGSGIGAEHTMPEHHGLLIMHERAANIGGELTIAPREGGGTRVCLQVPLAEEAQ
ncbi:MAG: histidine kinase, partial [Betaproteobacteria bacterium]